MKLKEIASRIREYLDRFESDNEINKPKQVDGLTTYYKAFSCVAGRYVFVRYICYQNGANLTKDEAIAYLNWLDEGNVGTHYRMKIEQSKQ